MPKRGEVWLVDLGMAQKTRPAVILSVPCGDNDRVVMQPSHVHHGREYRSPPALQRLGSYPIFLPLNLPAPSGRMAGKFLGRKMAGLPNLRNP